MSQYYDSSYQTSLHNEFYIENGLDQDMRIIVEDDYSYNDENTSIYSNKKHMLNLNELTRKEKPNQRPSYNQKYQYQDRYNKEVYNQTNMQVKIPLPIKLSKPKPKKYDMGIVNRLMDYIEVSLQKRLCSIEESMKKNDDRFKRVKQSYYTVEKKALEVKAEFCPGNNLLTDDIKFFFNLVKGGTTTPTKRPSDRNNQQLGSRKASTGSNKENSNFNIRSTNTDKNKNNSIPRSSNLNKSVSKHNSSKMKRNSIHTPAKHQPFQPSQKHSNQVSYNLTKAQESNQSRRVSLSSMEQQKRQNSRSFSRDTPNHNQKRSGVKNVNLNSSIYSRGRTNEKNYYKEANNYTKNLDFMNTLDMKANSRMANKYENF